MEKLIYVYISSSREKLNNINNIEHIHPRKQRVVEKVLKIIPVFSVFGSSIRWDCNEKSDIDLLIDINEINISKDEVFNKLAKTIDSDFDILWLDEIENALNINQKENILNRRKTVKILPLLLMN